jgi:uncharacterized protein YjeT (DUF2065 family)
VPEVLLLAIGLVLILEGIGPLAFPGRWRQVIETILRLNQGQLRFLGLASILLGLAVCVLSQLFN